MLLLLIVVLYYISVIRLEGGVRERLSDCELLAELKQWHYDADQSTKPVFKDISTKSVELYFWNKNSEKKNKTTPYFSRDFQSLHEKLKRETKNNFKQNSLSLKKKIFS